MNLFHLLPHLVRPRDDDDESLSHIACDCSPTVNLCGLVQEHTGWAEGPPPPNACVVCLDMNRFDCERCGR